MWPGRCSSSPSSSTASDPLRKKQKNDNIENASDSVASASDSADCHLLPLPIGEYEVFLNFRGPDTRYQITDILYRFLVILKIRTFKDDDELRKGEEIWHNLIEAIEQSQIYVPIFSENYAYSKWCLRELATIVERQEHDKRCIILPIFYMVDPGHVRHQSGPYWNAFEEHEKNFDEETIRVWRDALKKVGAMKGWHAKSSNEQGAIAEAVTKIIRKHLSNSYESDAGEFIGIDDHIDAVIERMRLNPGGVSIVGIHGIGGIGKTTIAKAVYNKVFSEFGRCSFLENVRETVHQFHGVLSLQKQIISNILGETSTDKSLSHGDQRIRLIRNRLPRFKFLLVLDDVGEKSEVDLILGNIKNSFSKGTFIITSRNIKVLSDLTEECKLYRVHQMSRPQALQLFRKYAFQDDSPLFETLSEDIVSLAAGLPLTLKVVGSSLYREKEVIWREKLSQLKQIPEEEVVERLKISYDTLNYEAKQIFLDIACLFIGEDKEMPSYMWSDCGFLPAININILVQRSMIEPGDNDVFRMHDQLRDMGREIVRRENIEHPSKRSRIWSKEEALGMLLHKKGTELVKCIQMNSSNYYSGFVKDVGDECLINLSALRYFDVKAEMLTGDFSTYLPNLRWLRADIVNGGRMPKICVENLVILELLSSVKDEWGRLKHIKMASKLKVLKLSGEFLSEYPHFPHSGSLEVLHLQNFGPWLFNRYLNIENLRNLKVLHLWYCQGNKIRGGTFGMMRGLRELNIIDVAFPLRMALCGIWDLQFLEILIIDPADDKKRSDYEDIFYRWKFPTNLKVLATPSPPANLLELLKLEKLTVDGGELKVPPADSCNMWWKMSKLESLTLENATMTPLKIRSSSFKRLLPSSLTTLHIMKCPEMKWLPNLENLENLIYLSIDGCHFLREIPGLGRLKSLEVLRISGLEAVRNLGGLDSVHSFTSFVGDHALHGIPSVTSLTKPPGLSTIDCHPLTEPQGLGGLESLQELWIDGAKSLTRLLGFETLLSFNKLEILTIKNCPHLTSLPFRDLEDERRLEAAVVYSLQKLKVDGTMQLLQIFCQMIQQSMFPILTELTLSCLGIDYTDTEVRLDGLESMEELVELSLHRLASIRRLPSVSKLQNLKNLTVTCAPNLLEIEGLADLKSLERLDLSGCTSLRRLSMDELSRLKQLKSLDISGCPSLIDLSDLIRLEPNVKILWQPNLDGSD